jgi:hypothetical protein
MYVRKGLNSREAQALAKSLQATPVFLRQPYVDALSQYAAEAGLKDAEAAARLLEDALMPYLDDAVAEQVRAERELLDLAESLAREEAADSWSEHLTLRVFERIRDDHLELYRAATQDDREDSMNRRIGRKVKDAIGAEVKTSKGRPVTVKVPSASNSLIRRYSVLRRPRR